jgi:predicted chitinase
VLIETAYTFAPICENGDTDYFTAHYWDDIAVRKALGNVVPTDAIEYHGRGFIQLTGRHNYEKCAGALNLPLMSQPELLLQPEASARACVWFWETHGLPEICNQVSKYKDAPSRERVWRMVRRKVNGGESGFLAFLSLLGALEIR